MYKVTVITSMFKGGKYLPLFLKDILEQTAFEECEWYLLDAASSDDEFSIIEPYLSYKNIRYERLDSDPGIYACWNYMINNSSSTYITNANLDDRLFPNSIQRHIESLDENPDCDLAYAENILTTTPNDSHRNYEQGGEVRTYPCGPFNREIMKGHNYPHSHPMWKRALHDKFGMFEEKYRSAGDYDFWLRCLAGGVNDFLYIPEVLGIYYFNPDGLSTKSGCGWRDREISEIRSSHVGNF